LKGDGFLLCGLDEAGRGPLAGPVAAAAVILAEDFPLDILRDSKKMSKISREKACLEICARAPAWGLGWTSAAEIDAINIHNASLLAMKRAFECMIEKMPENLRKNKIEAIADGLFVPDLPVMCKPLVNADNLVPEVMAASILAKTARDRLMDYYGIFFPEYGYEKHKGYPTKAHREAIHCFGPSPIQRIYFRVKD
jgi:ribonuclease HII